MDALKNIAGTVFDIDNDKEFYIRIGEGVTIKCPEEGISPQDVASHLSPEAAKVFLDVYNAIIQYENNIERNEKYADFLDYYAEHERFSLAGDWRKGNGIVVVEGCSYKTAIELEDTSLEWGKDEDDGDFHTSCLVGGFEGHEWKDGKFYTIFRWYARIKPDGKLTIFEEEADNAKSN